MEVVLLAHITFNRIGSASGGGGFQRQRQVRFSAEIADTDQSALRELVIEIAEAHGEAAGALKDLRYERSYAGEFVLNIQGPSTSYGTAYAECRVIHALKANGQYFQLQAIDDNDVTPYVSSRQAK
ncbi:MULTISPECIES: hypothetical protein [Pseudomonas]|uniref:hypothetical protein n=1 Tax=Pseudomonas TaxID=286 RepID=UPI000C2A47C6|nr:MULTISPECIES: hypothetical protein [Pseudomonas]PJY96959.1 hypothetical protein COO64_08990 [Pseudomonas donghuensis]WKY30350.1 hypothetical protein QYF67_10320 [Pseudomonas donghuensis]